MLRKQKYKLRFSDKKKLAVYIGLLFLNKRIPSCGYVSNVLETYNVIDEFSTA